MTGPASAVSFRDVALKLGGRTVLDAISLDIAEGEFVGLLGPNGAGKTTLIRAVLGLVPPARGSIRTLGRAAARGHPGVGYLPQIRALAAGGMRLSGRAMVASVVEGQRFGLPVLGRRGWAEVDRALDLVGGRELAARPLADMSGGERQRLLLAQALIGRPRLLLLDEPLVNLDPRHQVEVVERVQAIQRELGITVLFSTHELNPLLGAIDRVLYLGYGQAALGPVEAVITGPVLSRLYGSPIEVVRLGSRIFVMSGAYDVEHSAHRHECGAEPAGTADACRAAATGTVRARL